MGGRKGTPAQSEATGSFAPQEPTEEAAGSAAADTAPEASEAAGSAAAKKPRGREGRGRAGKHVTKKLEKKTYYEAQDLYRAYWGVRRTDRVRFEDATREYCEELLDHFNWHHSIGAYRQPDSVEEVVEEVPGDAGSAASASAAGVSGSEFLGEQPVVEQPVVEQPVVLTPRQPDYPPPEVTAEVIPDTRRPASPPVPPRVNRRRSSSTPPVPKGAGSAAPAARARSEEPVVEGRRRRKRRTSKGERGRAEEVHSRRPASPPTPRRSRSVALEERARRGRAVRPVVENVPGIPVPNQQRPPTIRVDRRGVWQLIQPAVAGVPAQRLVEVRPKGAGPAAPAPGSPDPHELADEVWEEPNPENRQRDREPDSLLVHRNTEVHDLAATDDLVLRGSFAAGEVVEAEEVERPTRRGPPVEAPAPKRQRRNYTYFADRNPRQDTWFAEPEGAGPAAPSSSARGATPKAESIPPPPPPPRKDPPSKKPPPELPAAERARRERVDPRFNPPDRAYKHPPPELLRGAGSAASGPPPVSRFTALGLDKTYGHPKIADRSTEPILVCLDYHNVLDLHEIADKGNREFPYSLDAEAVELLKLTAEQYNIKYDILSFVKGKGGINYVTPRIESIAKFLRAQGVEVGEAALCYEKCGAGGKAEWCYRRASHAILDDSPDIIQDCHRTGLFAVQVYPNSGSIKDAIFKLRARLQECTHAQFLQKYCPR